VYFAGGQWIQARDGVEALADLLAIGLFQGFGEARLAG
jgi:hypothetical protein